MSRLPSKISAVSVRAVNIVLTQHLCLSFICQQTRMCASWIDRSDTTALPAWLMSSKKWSVGVFWNSGDINYIWANTENCSSSTAHQLTVSLSGGRKDVFGPNLIVLCRALW